MGRAEPAVALALQGGGAHGAFTWGVLDRLLEDGVRIDRICGVSSGAILGVMLVQGLVRSGREGAREEMRKLWQRVAHAHAMSPMQAAPLERWLWGWDLSNSVMWQGMEWAMRMFSPSQLNPFGHNPLRLLLADLVEPALLTHSSAPALTVSATDVATGEAELFGNEFDRRGRAVRLVVPAVRIPGGADRRQALLGWRLCR